LNSAAVLLPPERQRSLLDRKIGAAYAAGTTSGALLTTLVAWCLSGFTQPLGPISRVILLCLGAGFIWLVKQGPLGRFVSLPESRRQIPAEVFRGGPVPGAYRFGFELGTGVRTYIPSPAPYLLLLSILVGSLTLGGALLIALGFGLGRALPLMVRISFAGRQQLLHGFLSGTMRFGPNLATVLVLIGGLNFV
jgi:hypothetical protein